MVYSFKLCYILEYLNNNKQLNNPKMKNINYSSIQKLIGAWWAKWAYVWLKTDSTSEINKRIIRTKIGVTQYKRKLKFRTMDHKNVIIW